MNSPLTGPSESPSLFWKLDFNLVLTQGQYSIAFFFFLQHFSNLNFNTYHKTDIKEMESTGLGD